MTESSGVDAAQTGREPLLWRVTPLAFAACAVAMILSLPLFPSQDGPVHLYYVDVLRGVISGSGPYAQHFALKSWMTPYMLEDYALLALETLFTPLMSEKLLICGYVLAFVGGFRYLVRSATEFSGPWTLAGAAFCLNAYIYWGFLNYAFGTALALLLSGCWMRWMKRLTPRRAALLSGGIVVILLTHPLPAAIFLVFAALHTAVSFVDERMDGTPAFRSAWRIYRGAFGLLAAMGVASACWVSRFRYSPQSTGGVPKDVRPLLHTAGAELKLWSLSPLTDGAYRLVLLIVLAFAGIALLAGLWKSGWRARPAVISMAGMAAICFIACCVMPASVNGGYYFPLRFSIFWVVFLLAASAAMKPPRWCASSLGVVALGAASAVLIFQWTYLSGVTRELNIALNAPLVKPGSLGVIVSEARARSTVAGDPFLWASAHYFRGSEAILTNAPWMDSPIIMLRPLHEDSWTYKDPDKAPPEIVDTVNRTGSAPLDFAVRADVDGLVTQETIERLGFRPFSSSPRMSFYSRR